MISSLITIAVIGIVLTLIAMRNAKDASLFTFAFLFPAVTVAFVLVEFSDFVLNAGVLFEIYQSNGVMNIALFMLATCSLAGLAGYTFAKGPSGPTVSLRERFKLPKRMIGYMHIASIVLGAISFLAFLALANLGGGLQEYILYSGNYAIEWRGLPVYLIFLVRLCYVSIVIQLWLWSYTRRSKHLRWALILSIIPLINILFLFRRSEVIKLGVFYGYFLTNYFRVRIGRATAFFGIVAMYGAFKVFPLLRGGGAGDASAGELLTDALSTRETYENSEIASGLFRIYQSMESGVFEYGAIMYNAVIKQFVPAGLVGPQTKAALMAPTVEYADTYFMNFRFYVSPMGFAQAYQQFWLLGGLLFLVIGIIMARIERASERSPRMEVFLVLMIPAAISTVSADITFFVPQFIIYLVMTLLCVPSLRYHASAVTQKAPWRERGARMRPSP